MLLYLTRFGFALASGLESLCIHAEYEKYLGSGKWIRERRHLTWTADVNVCAKFEEPARAQVGWSVQLTITGEPESIQRTNL